MADAPPPPKMEEYGPGKLFELTMIAITKTNGGNTTLTSMNIPSPSAPHSHEPGTNGAPGTWVTIPPCPPLIPPPNIPKDITKKQGEKRKRGSDSD